MHLFEGPNLVHNLFIVDCERKEIRKKPSTQRDSNPLPHKFLLSRRVLYHSASIDALNERMLPLSCLIVTRLTFQIPGHLPPSRVSSPLLKDESSHLGFALRLDRFGLVLLTLAVLQQGSYHQRFIGSIRNRRSQKLLNDNTEGGFLHFYLLPAFLQLVFQPLMSAQTGFLI